MESSGKIRTTVANREAHLQGFINHIRGLMFSGRYSDIILYNTKNLSQRQFHFSKIILASMSDYFAELFLTHVDQKYIGVPGTLYKPLIYNILISLGVPVSMTKNENKGFMLARDKYKFTCKIINEDVRKNHGGVLRSPIPPHQDDDSREIVGTYT